MSLENHVATGEQEQPAPRSSLTEAAPDLLYALKIAREYVIKIDGTMSFTPAADRLTAFDLRLIDRAIAKAKGAA